MKIPENVLLETKLPLNFVLKEIEINEVLNGLAVMPFDYSLYGGTAINKVYLKQRRFSEDVDLFVYKTGISAFWRFLKKTLQGTGARAGGESVISGVSKPKRIFRESYRMEVFYEFPEYAVKDNLHVDVNLNLKKRKSEGVEVEPGSFLNNLGFFVRNLPVKTFKPATLTATKLLALETRREGKDYFDLYHLLNDYSFSASELSSEAGKYADCFFDFLRVDEFFFDKLVESVSKARVAELQEYDKYILSQHRVDWELVKRDLLFKLNKYAKKSRT
jgi:predicted nucleotidyltransferase component of viral defense system